jgi:hypothetical protein
VVCLAGLLYVYHPIIWGGLGTVSADAFDGRIMITILEHWFNVFSFREAPLDPLYFHPFKNVLAYNDGLLISGFFYSLFRAIGADPFLAYEFLNWTVRTIGCLATIAAARRVLGLTPSASLAAGFLLLVATNLALRMNHAQLLYAGFLPLGLLVFTATHAALARGSNVRAAGAIIGFALFILSWALTAFYSLYTFCLFLAVYVGWLNIVSPATRSETARIVRDRFRLVAFAAIALAGVGLSVLAVYSRALGVAHDVSTIRQLAGHPVDLMNIGAGNLIWSPILARVYHSLTGEELVSSELSTGFTPVLLVCFLAALAWLWHARRSQTERFAQHIAIALACLTLAMLSLKLGGRAAWEPIFRFVPGARAIRVPMRLLLFITPFIILIVMAGLEGGFGLRQRRWLGMAVLIIAVEQYRIDLPFTLDRIAETAFLARVPTPPATCRSFYVSVPRIDPTGNPTLDQFYVGAVDAMLLAEMLRLPTINGMASFQPAGWDLQAPFNPTYQARVMRYAEAHRLNGLCALDLKAFRWSATEHGAH